MAQGRNEEIGSREQEAGGAAHPAAALAVSTYCNCCIFCESKIVLKNELNSTKIGISMVFPHALSAECCTEWEYYSKISSQYFIIN